VEKILSKQLNFHAQSVIQKLFAVINVEIFQLSTSALAADTWVLEMGMSAVQFKVMPKGLDVNLDELKLKINKNIEDLGGNPSSNEEVPIAFGLKAVVFSFAFPEEKEIEEVEKRLNELEGVSSIEMIDYRRALG